MRGEAERARQRHASRAEHVRLVEEYGVQYMCS